ncbi:MAG: ATP-binding protein [Bryobacterales bacterium]|nr:ATP-binding protein [Bryobacterales bacterium]
MLNDSMLNLTTAVTESERASRQTPVPEPREGFTPAVPERIGDTGLAETNLEQLILKTLHFSGELLGRELASGLGLKFSLIEPLVENLRRQRMLEVKGSLGYGAVSAVYTLSENGRARAREYLETNQYSGRAPVAMEQYVEAVRSQRLHNGWLTREALVEAYRHMVVTDDIFNQIGPAVNSGKSFLLYGKPGNGKTYLAEALFNLESSPIFVPYAVEYQGLIIKIFDPVYHIPIAAETESVIVNRDSSHDQRWVLCKRPFIVTGGELTLDMLDLTYIETAKIYDAPFQMKANNGIYLIDDFGRQRVSPAEVLNRWIVPMDRRVDYLRFITGGKVEVPFETFLIFSTNLRAEHLGDEAFLRRIAYKMFLRSPEVAEFQQIFDRFCAQQKIACAPPVRDDLIERHFRGKGRPMRRCHPRDLISHAIDIIHFDRLPFVLTSDLLDQAVASCFVDEGTEED